MLLGTVDINGMSPSGWRQLGILMADEAVAPAAGTPFTMGTAFVTDQDVAGRLIR